MAFLFTLGLLSYYFLIFRRNHKNECSLALLLWFSYFFLGLSGIFIELSAGIEPSFEPNYQSILVLFTGVVLSISGFSSFRAHNVSQIFGNIRGQKIIENFLIFSQLLSLGFFLPFAMSALVGNINENRLLLDERMIVLGSYGLINTFASAASQLFVASLVLAFIRLASKNNEDRSVLRGYFLVLSSLSYVIYIFAYVGRDGVVYWLMTIAAVYIVFRKHLSVAVNQKVIGLGAVFVSILLIPFGIITASRFFDADERAWWSFFEYFGAQIHNFSDYSSIDRPLTYGFMSFPMFLAGGCKFLGLSCPSWLDMKDIVFQQYLNQGKAPWLFGTFVSDFVGDFGDIGALLIIFVLSRFCSALCDGDRFIGSYSLARLLLIMFLFLIPYWGIFYFRFGIANGFIIVNLLFILLVAVLQYLVPRLGKRSFFALY